MRIRLFLALTSVSLVATGLGIEACGGTTTDTSTTADSSAEAAVDAADAADAADTAPQCDPKADPLSSIPDASIADGASTTGVCVGCVESKCKAEVAKCAADCPCQNVASTALTCYTKNPQNLLACLSALAGVPKATQTIGGALIGCVQASCAAECAASAFTGDAGDAGDAGN